LTRNYYFLYFII